MNCWGPVLDEADGCWYCRMRPDDDEFDCEACRAAEQEWADRANDLEAA